MASSCKHECKNKHDSFCHVCGCYTLPHQKRNITLFVKHTYKAYFQIPLGDQDKKWSSHIMCHKCEEILCNRQKENVRDCLFELLFINFISILRIKQILILIISSSFGLSLQSGVATPYYLSPNRPVFNVHLLHTNFPISSFTTSKNLLFGFLLFFFLGNFHHLSSYILLVSPHDMSIHLSLPSLIFILNCSPITVPLMYSFVILSFLVTPIANLNIFISVTSISFACFL